MVTASSLTLSVGPAMFAACRFDHTEPIPAWSLHGLFTRTEDALSIACLQANVPPDLQADGFEGGWRCVKVEGPLDFALTGLLAAIAVPLAEAGISIFALSTDNIDYVLVKQRDLDRAVQTLAHAGHRVMHAAG